jgi:hypothetical protein
MLKSNFAAKTQDSVGTWRILGPLNSATTTYSAQGNHGGYVILNRFDPTNTQKMFTSFQTGGLWVSDDGGANWSLSDDAYPDDYYLDIDVCLASPSTVYALSTSQLLKSTDGGLNWQPTSLNGTNYSGKKYDLMVSSSDPNVVIVRVGMELLRSADGGSTWNVVLSGIANNETSGWCSLGSEVFDFHKRHKRVYSHSFGPLQYHHDAKQDHDCTHRQFQKSYLFY